MATNNESKFGLSFWYKIGGILVGFEIINKYFEKLVDYLNINSEHKIAILTSKTKFIPDVTFQTIAIIEVFFLFIISVSGQSILRIVLSKETKRKNSLLIHRNLKTIMNCITLISASWLLIYLWLFIFWNGELVYNIDNSYSFVWTIADFFHALTAFFSFFCFFILEKPITTLEDDKQRRHLLTKNSIVIGLITLSLFLFSAFGRFFYNGFDKLGPMMLSFWVGLSMQYLFGKLDSIHLGVKRVFLAPLYLYILLQIMWASLADILSHQELTIIYTLAFGLKVYFFIMMIYWLAGTKKFIRYLKFTIDKAQTVNTSQEPKN